MTIMYDASAKGTIITYTSSIFSTPVILTGAGIDDWLSIDDVDGAVVENGMDGSLSCHVKATHVTGKITLQPLSPTLVNTFIKVMKRQYEIGACIPGVLNITNPTGLWNITFQNFVITSAFKGYEFGEKVKDVTINFGAQLPDTSIVGDLLSIGSAITNLIGA